MDETRLNHPVINGPGMWNLLHTFAAEAVDEKTKDHFEYFVKIFLKRIKCKSCLEDINIFMRDHPLEKYKNITQKGIPIGYYIWSNELHNHVNKKLKKKIVSVDESYGYYKNNFFCFSCS